MALKRAPVYFLSHGGPSLMFDDEVDTAVQNPLM